jgi:hypothetical protein
MFRASFVAVLIGLGFAAPFHPLFSTQARRPQSPQTQAASNMTSCTIWRTATGSYFLKTKSGWVEVQDDKLYCRFQETQRTADYVELFDPCRTMWVRLGLDDILWKKAGTDWNLLPAKGRGSEELAINLGTDSRQMNDCTLWRYEAQNGKVKAYFIKKANNEWVEVQDDKLYCRFKETERVAEYIELYDS